MRRLTEGQRELAASFFVEAKRIAGVIAAGQSWRRDDIESAAMYGLVKAAALYPEGGATFGKYAGRACRNEVVNYFESSGAKSRDRQPGDLGEHGLAEVADRGLGPPEECEMREAMAAVGTESGRLAAGLCVECAAVPTPAPGRKWVPVGRCLRCYNRAMQRAKRKALTPVEA